METKQAVMYLRASKDFETQSNSFEVQKTIVERFAQTNGYEIIDTFCEYRTGGDDERVEFNKALKYCIKNDCTLICWKVDRLARTMSVFSKIQDHLGKLRFAELGDIEPNIMVLGVLLGVATQERINTSIRVKETYKAIKAKNPNKEWGNPNINETAYPASLVVRQSNAREFNTHIQGVVLDLKKAGYLTLNDISVRLNQLGFTTRRGSAFTIHNLHRVLNYGV